jgi:hypothetical protein
MKKYLFAFLLALIATVTHAQEEEKKEMKEEETLKGTHSLTLLIGHSHLSQGIMENGEKGWKAIPSWGFDYNYWLGNKWALGLHNDMMIENFEVEDHENTVIERSTPIASVAVVTFKPGKHVGFLAGMGGEFAKEGNFALSRLGIESSWEMKNNWEFGIGLVYDIKWNGYDTWVFGFGITKLLRKKAG